MLTFEKKSKNRYKIYIDRGYGMSMGNMLDVIGGKVEVKGNWIEVEKKHHSFRVVDDNMTVKKGNWVTENTDLGFSWWDKEVTDLDGNSDESQCFGMSSKLKWNEVIMEPTRFHAPSIERLCEALEHVNICAWCPGDI